MGTLGAAALTVAARLPGEAPILPPSIASTSAAIAISAIRATSMRTVVSVGVTTDDQTRSSKPVTLTSSGTPMPARCSSVNARSACRSESAAKAVNASGRPLDQTQAAARALLCLETPGPQRLAHCVRPETGFDSADAVVLHV